MPRSRYAVARLILSGARQDHARNGGSTLDMLAHAYAVCPQGHAKRLIDLAATAIERGYHEEADCLMERALRAIEGGAKEAAA